MEPEQPAPQAAVSDQQPINRSELLSRARTFLSTPHIRSQDNAAKHAFLVEKGLTQDEIDLLLREIVSHCLCNCFSQVAHQRLATINSATDVSPTSSIQSPKHADWGSTHIHMAHRNIGVRPLHILRTHSRSIPKFQLQLTVV